MRTIPLAILLAILSTLVGGCGSRTPDSSPSQERSGAGGVSSAEGFNSPDAGLTAYGKALVDGNAAAYRKIAAKDTKAIKSLDAIIQFEKDKSPDEAAKINLRAMAPLQGFGDVVAKRFPAEINGDNAVIVQVFERDIALKKEIHFRKFEFSKSGGRWYLVGQKFGDASELPAKYAWNKTTEPKIVDSSTGAPKPVTPKPKSDGNETETGDGSIGSDGGDSRADVSPRREVELFNGENLSGWTYLPMKNSKHRSNKSWFADKERQVLYSVGRDRNELSTAETYRDFVLKLQWRWRPGSQVSPNGSGVVVRVDGRSAKGTDPKGVEIDLRPNEDKEIGLGSGTFIAYNVSLENHRGAVDGVKNRILGWKRRSGPIVDGQWNDLHISCIEDRLTVTLNGVVVNEGWKLSAREGKIVLRNQNSGVEFRNIKLSDVQPGTDVGAKHDSGSSADPPANTPDAKTHRPPPKGHSEFRDLAVKSLDCRVFFPGKPKFTEQNVKIAEGNVHVANFQGRTARATYVFEIYTYPERFVAKTGGESLLKQTRDNLVGAPTGRLISNKSHTYQASRANDFVYENPDTAGSGRGYCRLVMRGNRIYLMEVVGSKIPPADITVFHDSLAPFPLDTSGTRQK